MVAAAHLALFAWVGLRTPLTFMRPMDPLRPVEAFLVPPPPPPPPREASSDSPPNRAASYRPRLILPVAPVEVAPIPAPPAGPAAPGTSGRSAPAPLPAPWDGLRRALRGSPVGCAERDRVGLTVAERAACDERAGAVVAKALPLGLDADKQAGFDLAAAAKARNRREREGPMGDPMPACAGALSNLGVACNPGH